jgi:uncharacterized membrane protein
MVQKAVGYVLVFLGIVAIAFSFPSAEKTTGLTLPEALNPTILLIGGIAFVIISVLIFKKSTSKERKHSEVPIYKGKEIVGYRRE